MPNSDDEKLDDDTVTREDLEELVRAPARPVSDFFVGDRSFDYYLGFLRALQVTDELASLKPNEQNRRRRELIAVTAQAALDQQKRVPPIDWNAAQVPTEIRKTLSDAWREVRRCLAAESPGAAIAMCGRLLEIVLWRLWREEADPDQFAEDRKAKIGLDALHNRVTKRRIPEHKIVIETVIKYRNASVHSTDYVVELDDATEQALKVRRVVMDAWQPRQPRTRTRNTTQRT